jgi:hypothetical protein
MSKSKAIIVPDLAFTTHKGRRGGKSSGYKELKAQLKYYQFRDDRNGHIPQEEGLERWVDNGYFDFSPPPSSDLLPFYMGMGRHNIEIVPDFTPRVMKDIENAIAEGKVIVGEPHLKTSDYRFDVFISYASEDKQYVLQLVTALKFYGLRVWFDELNLQVGDGLLQSIDKGLEESHAAILVISPYYLKKPWPKHEFKTAFTRYMRAERRLFPILHGVTIDDATSLVYAIRDIKALDSKDSVQISAQKIVSALTSRASSRALMPSWEDPF